VNRRMSSASQVNRLTSFAAFACGCFALASRPDARASAYAERMNLTCSSSTGCGDRPRRPAHPLLRDQQSVILGAAPGVQQGQHVGTRHVDVFPPTVDPGRGLVSAGHLLGRVVTPAPRPSDDGGRELFDESIPNRRRNSATLAVNAAITTSCSAIRAACSMTSAARSSYDGRRGPERDTRAPCHTNQTG